MKYKEFKKIIGDFVYDEKKKTFYTKSKSEITDLKHSKSSNFEVGDRVRKVNALETSFYEIPSNTEGILLFSIFIDELDGHVSFVKFENLEEIVATREIKLELIE